MFTFDKKLRILNCLSFDEWTSAVKLKSDCGIKDDDVLVRNLEDLATGGFVEGNINNATIKLQLNGSKSSYLRKRNKQIFHYVATSASLLIALYSVLR